ncbi:MULTISPECIES: aminoglycoside adenylyltransferase domain-containing protein [Achromobacter]|uniref:aminoglycoside adenylyltransferase domain-containing protein n=1 Tax=Achromobacter TaxID=222 RepID=UPI001F3AAE31|nr:aminoglycoside adenylyltransferase domain-containing protein [Achromobacter sp. K91]
MGPQADQVFEPVPREDLRRALLDTAAQWNAPDNWAGDEKHIVLALARIWYTAALGGIASKELAATRLQ